MKRAVERLEIWYQKHHRSLPWRETTDPYAIWISETMLQQTQVATVIPYYVKFLNTFPTLTALARSDESDVLRLWSGLGYYSRARNLHRGARSLLQNHAGQFPISRAELEKVPGIGPYTAGAILSIAFDLRESAVDGNVLRVLSRFLASHKCIDETKHRKYFWKVADGWILHALHPRHYNQSLMELGATICTKANPKCGICPIAFGCAAKKLELQSLLPVRKKRRQVVSLRWTLLVYEKRGKIFLKKNGPGEWGEGLWDLPRTLDRNTKGERLASQNHTITHHKIKASAVLIRNAGPSAPVKGTWLPRSAALKAAISSLTRKVLASLEL